MEIRRIVVTLLNKDPAQRPYSQELIQNFFLPPPNGDIGELVFDEMQERRSKYEETRYEKVLQEKQFVQPAP